MVGSGRALGVSGRVYRMLLLAYPRDFRDAYGPQMEQAFLDLCRQALDRGGALGLIRLWFRTLLDLARVRSWRGVVRCVGGSWCPWRWSSGC